MLELLRVDLAGLEPRVSLAHVLLLRPMLRRNLPVGRYYLMPMFSLTVWLIFGKLWEARSRLYRSRSLQRNTRLKALAEI